MSNRRPQILMGILLVLVLGYVSQPYWNVTSSPNPVDRRESQPAPALKGSNSLSGLKVYRTDAGIWVADFDYRYTGNPPRALLQLTFGKMERGDTPPGMVSLPPWNFIGLAAPGEHHLSAPLPYPGPRIRTLQVQVVMRDPRANMGEFVAQQQVAQVIDWPDVMTWQRDDMLARNTPEQNLQKAVALVDNEDVDSARPILERLLEQNPKMDAAYVELARVAMKSNWGPEGLHQAENLLGSALQIRPDSVNAKILLGYVYANQRRFAQAQALFAQAQKANPPNLWLWVNWAQMLVTQGKLDQAIAKYREALARPMTHDTYDRARHEGYSELIALLNQRKDFDGMEALYKQQAAEFGPGSCYTADYARFMLLERGNVQAAIDLARGALNQSCTDTRSRQTLGLAEYVQWAGAKGPSRSDYLNQARLYLPEGPYTLYMLAGSDKTFAAVRELVAAGESVDQKDNSHLTALAHALQNGDQIATKHLLRLGARKDILVGEGDVPIALVPVMAGNFEGIQLLRQSGVDYSKIRYRGLTAFDFAKQTGNRQLQEVLGVEGQVL